MDESTVGRLVMAAEGFSELACSPQELSAHPDPIGCDFNFSLKAVFYPLGFAVEISTNAPQVLAAAQENWKSFHKVSCAPPVQVRIAVMDGQATHCPPPPTCRGQRNLVMFVASPYDFAVCDLATGFASCWLSRNTVENSAYLRYHFLDSTVLLLIEALYLTPIHAACVAFQGCGLLLCGDSGVGKSSLSFACARRGWTFVSDDATFLVRGGKQRIVVGNPYHLHLRESATELFPDLKSHWLTQRINGEMAIELETASIPEIVTCPQSAIDFVVFLNRGTVGPASLRSFSKERASVCLEQVICYGEQHLRDAQKSSLRDLLRTETLELRYNDLHSAVVCLESLVRSVGKAAETRFRHE
jgi:hypothetical protein